MSTEGATTTDGGSADAGAPPQERRPVEERAEEIVEQAVRFARRLVARAREEVEDIVAEAQNLRRGAPPRE